ncbi:hypothetical protein EDD15DRAFT_2272969 [Pisolithus albus]|nr:hypothetical protein EDD15DRAFT_2272969 [Pisolithus albus]
MVILHMYGPPSEGSLSISFCTIPTTNASPTPIIISSSYTSRRTLPIWSILQLLLLFTTVFSLARPVTEVSFVLMCGS